MLNFNYGHKVCFSPRPFRVFKKWTKKMSKIENPNTFGKKKSLKYNKSPKLLKESKCNYAFSIPTTFAIFLMIFVSFS